MGGEHFTAHRPFRVSVQLKLVQRLGYFLSPSEAPSPIIEHIRKVADIHVKPTSKQWANYQRSGTRQRHITQIRQHHGIRRFTQHEHDWLRQIAETAAFTKEAVTDIVNVMLEELVHHRFELPAQCS